MLQRGLLARVSFAMAKGLKFDIWARVNVSVKQTRVVAATSFQEREIGYQRAKSAWKTSKRRPMQYCVSQIDEAVGMISEARLSARARRCWRAMLGSVRRRS